MMTWQQFAKVLFDSWDSDPGYAIMAFAKMPTVRKQRFMTAWVSYYNLGIAARASEMEGTKFWDYIWSLLPTAKRASERRHFRGKQAEQALTQWQTKFYRPEYMVTHMEGKDYFEVKKKGKDVIRIGEYFVWKFADVQERVFRKACAFPPSAAKHSPKVPQQGAELIFPYDDVLGAYTTIAKYMNNNGMTAPPWFDRPMNMQEAETVCCVYKQYVNGKWCIGSRSAKAVRALLATPSDTATEMLREISKRIEVPYKRLPQWYEETLNKL